MPDDFLSAPGDALARPLINERTSRQSAFLIRTTLEPGDIDAVPEYVRAADGRG